MPDAQGPLIAHAEIVNSKRLTALYLTLIRQDWPASRPHVREGESRALGAQQQEQVIQMSIDESGAMIHRHQADVYISESLPFDAPGQVDDHASILSFNTLPIPDSGLVR